MCPLRTNRRVRKLKMANIKEEHAEKEVASHSSQGCMGESNEKSELE